MGNAWSEVNRKRVISTLEMLDLLYYLGLKSAWKEGFAVRRFVERLYE